MSRVPPVRTCVGCREHATKSELLRVVAVADGPSWSVVPDSTGRMSGRGAHVHPTQTCLDHAVRRRALPRALRLDAAADISAVQAEIAARSSTASAANQQIHQGRPLEDRDDQTYQRKRSSSS